jgi:hypothetical protein
MHSSTNAMVAGSVASGCRQRDLVIRTGAPSASKKAKSSIATERVSLPTHSGSVMLVYSLDFSLHHSSRQQC